MRHDAKIAYGVLQKSDGVTKIVGKIIFAFVKIGVEITVNTNFAKGAYCMVIDDIKRMHWSHLRAGATGPGKITMSRKTFYEMASSVRELMWVDAGDHPEWTVCGMQIEVRDDVDPEIMFIIS